MPEVLKKEYTMRLIMKLKSELNPRNKITGIRELDVPVLRYCFSIINWMLEEIKMDSKTNKTGSVQRT
jgi:hypothetical protein